MAPTHQGSIRLFQFGGIQVYLHWSWFIVALIEFNNRGHAYSSLAWNALEYITLFAIVLVHEFGHSLACRQVGGRADQIILWPLGGVAYVAPPQRPGATLWSIAAGPLVNVVLAPILIVLLILAGQWDLVDRSPDAYRFIQAICYMNIGLLIFNLLPIYPLDGGQILRSLLWFVLGRARSLTVASVIGICGVLGLGALGLVRRDVWILIIAAFILFNCWQGLMQARLLARVARLPRRQGFACPSCHQPPPLGPFWRCAKCMQPFDTFETHSLCPHCGTESPVTQCLDCGEARPISAWSAPSAWSRPS